MALRTGRLALRLQLASSRRGGGRRQPYRRPRPAACVLVPGGFAAAARRRRRRSLPAMRRARCCQQGRTAGCGKWKASCPTLITHARHARFPALHAGRLAAHEKSYRKLLGIPIWYRNSALNQRYDPFTESNVVVTSIPICNHYDRTWS